MDATVRFVRLLQEVQELPAPAAAARIAAAGVPVFPCRSGQKRPSTVHGLLDASADRAEVRAWWRRWPTANIGLPTGAMSGVVVLDIDVRPAGSGQGAFSLLVRRGLADQWAGVVRTPSGGVHAYYPADPGHHQRCWQAGDRHIDFRGDGGYVLVPPSAVLQRDGTKRGYSFASAPDARATLRFLDSDAVRECLVPGSTTRSSLIREGEVRPGADPDRLAAWVAARVEGERNRGLFWAACRLAETGTPTRDIHGVLGPAAEQAGLPVEEITSTIRSAARAAAYRPAPGLPPTARQERPPIRGPDFER